MKKFLFITIAALGAMLVLSACATPEPEVIIVTATPAPQDEPPADAGGSPAEEHGNSKLRRV